MGIYTRFVNGISGNNCTARNCGQGAKMLVSVFCSIPFLLSVVLLFFYEIDKQKEVQIEQAKASQVKINEQIVTTNHKWMQFKKKLLLQHSQWLHLFSTWCTNKGKPSQGAIIERCFYRKILYRNGT
jgi:hypothetical protein